MIFRASGMGKLNYLRVIGEVEVRVQIDSLLGLQRGLPKSRENQSSVVYVRVGTQTAMGDPIQIVRP